MSIRGKTPLGRWSGRGAGVVGLAVLLCSSVACQQPSVRAPSAAAPLAPQSQPARAPAAQTALPPQMIDLVKQCRRRFTLLKTYTAVLTKQERNKGGVLSREVIAVRVREQPWSIYMKWLEGAYRNREALYVKGRNDNRLYAMMGDMLFTPLFKLPTNSPLVNSFSRYPITQAGVGRLVDKLEAVTDAPDPATFGAFDYAGLAPNAQGRPEYRLVQHPPDGGRRLWTIDQQLMLPVGVATTDANGQLVASYTYSHLVLNCELSEADFDPSALWPGRTAVPVGMLQAPPDTRLCKAR